MNRLPLVGFSVALLASLLGAQVAPATVIFAAGDVGVGPTDPRPNSDAEAASFDAAASALGSLNLVTLEDQPLGYFSSATLAPGVTATFINADPTLAGINNALGSATTGFNTTAGGSQSLTVVPPASSAVTSVTLRFLFDQPIQAGGLYLTGLEGGLGALTAFFDDGTSVPFEGQATGGAQFFGFTSPGSAFSMIDLVLSNPDGFEQRRDRFAVDDLRFVLAAQPVPEPSTFVLLGTAATCWGVFAFRRRRRRTRNGQVTAYGAA